MASFLEKLRKGMGIEENEEKQEEKEEEKKDEKEEKEEPKIELVEEKKPKKEKLKKEEKKIEIKTETIDLDERKEKRRETIFEEAGELAVDLYETDSYVVLKAAIAGIKPEDLDIEVEGDMLSIKGERRDYFEQVDEKKNYLHQECYWGAFKREMILPVEVDGSRAEASMKEGLLMLKIPKIQREGRKSIKVRNS